MVEDKQDSPAQMYFQETIQLVSPTEITNKLTIGSGYMISSLSHFL